MKYDYLVFIGRFQPYHVGHHAIVKEALKQSENLIFVLGSHDRPRSCRHPFTTNERMDIINSANADVRDRLLFVFQPDHPYNEEKWIAEVQSAVYSLCFRTWTPGSIKIGLIGHNKDHSSYYLKKFPHWESVDVQQIYKCNATDFRNAYFSGTKGVRFKESFAVNDEHWDAVMKHSDVASQEGVGEEMRFISKYQLQWQNSPYPPTFVTTDAVVTQSGHLLVITRGDHPGKGQLALPGGFLNEYETLLDGVLRELSEETKLKVPKPVLIGSIVKDHTYDDPYRSARGRTITHAYHFKLADREDLPEIKAGSDAKKAYWMPLSEFVKQRNNCFEDHHSIVEHMLGL
jgi:bifunctional NMN adenylyltransferase/nudix hydrolase